MIAISTPIDTPNGKHSLVFLYDVTDREHASQTARRDEALLRQAGRMAHIGNFSLRTDESRETDAWSDVALTIIGRPRDTPALGLREFVSEVIHPDDRMFMRLLIRRMIREGDAFTANCRIVRPEGPTRWVQIAGEAVRGWDGIVGSIIGTIMDVTRLRILEKEILAVGTMIQTRIGQDIHDGLGSHIIGIYMILHSMIANARNGQPILVGELEEIAELVRQAANQARDIARGLIPTMLDTQGFAATLHDMATSLATRFGVECTVDADPVADELEKNAATQMYWIAHEAATNAAKHANATNIVIKVEWQQTALTLTVYDNGRGLPTVVDDDQGLGLHIMRYRAHLIGATLAIDSSQSKGTTVTCALRGPLPRGHVNRSHNRNNRSII